MQARPVYVLGSGFSRAINPSMPTLSELSEEVVGELGTSAPRGALEYGGDFERWLSFLAEPHPWLSERESLENRAGFLRITAMLGRLLRTNQQKALEQEIPQWLRVLVRSWVQQKAVVITLNYDWLVEAAYECCVTVPSRFDRPGDDEYVSYSALYPTPVPPWGSRTGLAVLGSNPVEVFDLLKLHGSLNWLWTGLNGNRSEPIFDGGIANWRGSSRDRTLNSVSGDPDLLRREPLIVPPTATKNVFLDHTFFGDLWKQAHSAIGQASEITIIGYSLPQTDRLISDLLLSAGGPKSVRVVDVNPRASQHVRDVLIGWTAVEVERDLTAYVRTHHAWTDSADPLVVASLDNSLSV